MLNAITRVWRKPVEKEYMLVYTNVTSIYNENHRLYQNWLSGAFENQERISTLFYQNQFYNLEPEFVPQKRESGGNEICTLPILRKASAIRSSTQFSEIHVPGIDGNPIPSLRHCNIRHPSILGYEPRVLIRHVAQLREHRLSIQQLDPPIEKIGAERHRSVEHGREQMIPLIGCARVSGAAAQ